MHIAHLTSAHPRDDIRVFHKECCSLKRAGYDVTLVVADGLEDSIVNGVRILSVGLSKGRIGRVFGGTKKVLKKAVEINADLYHIHDPELMPAGLRLKRMGKKVIFDAHEDLPKQVLSKPYLFPAALKFLSIALSRFEKFACSRFDGVVAATPTISEKFRLINSNTVNINNFPILGELESNCDWGARAAEICYVGSIAKVRGVMEMLEALSLVSQSVRLNLVGSFSDSSIQTAAKAASGWVHVNEYGVLDRDGVRGVLSRSSAGLVTLHPITNYLDSLPIKMFEYMAAGIPVIASNFPLWKEIVEQSRCGVCVDPMSPKEIAAAIDYFMQNPAKAEEMGRNGVEAVYNRFNWQVEERKLLSFYERVLVSTKN